MIGCPLGVLLAFDCWLENGARKYLLWAWGAFLLGALSKEFLYIFPVTAGALLLKPSHIKVERKRALLQVAPMFGSVLMLYGYRYLVLPDPYNPQPLKQVHLIKKPFLYWLDPFYDTVLLGLWWMTGLALLLLLMGKTLLIWRQSRYSHWPARPFAGIAIALAMSGIVALYNELMFPGFTNAFWYLFDSESWSMNLEALGRMIFAWCALYLLWKYRRGEPILSVVLLLMLSYVPVFTYLGWHFTLTGWFIRTALLWPLLIKLALLDGAQPWLTKLLLLAAHEQVVSARNSLRS